MSDNSYSAVNALVDIFAAPKKALEEVRDHVSWLWWPLLISLALAVALIVYYHTWVDLDWLIDNEISKIPAESRAASADARRQGAVEVFLQVVRVLEADGHSRNRRL